MAEFIDHLWQDLVRDHGADLVHGSGRQPAPSRRVRPRLLAGGALGLAGAGTALGLLLGVATAPPAFAVTTNPDGSVIVQIDNTTALPAANHKLTAMGIGEQVTIYMASGPATTAGAVSCTPAPGASLTGPPINVLVGTNGTQVISPATSAASAASGTSGVGTWHLARCVVTGDTGSGTSGTSGTGSAS